jgi:HPt (histidine-containing phosphotransfer) domain-containing protein
MNDFLTKPIRPHELIAALARPRVVAAPPGAAFVPKQATVLDTMDLLDRLNGDPQLLVQVTALYRSNRERYVDSLRDALFARDAPKIAEMAHSLLGMFRILSAPRAAELTATVHDLDPCADRERIDEVLLALEREAQAIESALVQLASAMPPAEPALAYAAPDTPRGP